MPVEFTHPQSPAIYFAGLWSRAHFGGIEIETCAIVTRLAIPPLDELHKRMPAIVSPDDYKGWLDPTVTEVALFERGIRTDLFAKFAVLDHRST